MSHSGRKRKRSSTCAVGREKALSKTSASARVEKDQFTSYRRLQARNGLAGELWGRGDQQDCGAAEEEEAAEAWAVKEEEEEEDREEMARRTEEVSEVVDDDRVNYKIKEAEWERERARLNRTVEQLRLMISQERESEQAQHRKGEQMAARRQADDHRDLGPAGSTDPDASAAKRRKVRASVLDDH